MIAYIGNDNVVRLSGARAVSLTTGVTSYLTGSATVRFRLQTVAGVDVLGETWPVTMTYIAGSNGDFIAVVRNEVQLAAGTMYRFLGTVDNGANQYGDWDLPLLARVRRG